MKNEFQNDLSNQWPEATFKEPQQNLVTANQSGSPNVDENIHFDSHDDRQPSDSYLRRRVNKVQPMSRTRYGIKVS